MVILNEAECEAIEKDLEGGDLDDQDKFILRQLYLRLRIRHGDKKNQSPPPNFEIDVEISERQLKKLKEDWEDELRSKNRIISIIE